MNPVAKNCYKFNKPKVERNRKAYSRTTKHKQYQSMFGWFKPKRDKARDSLIQEIQTLQRDIKRLSHVVETNQLFVDWTKQQLIKRG